MYTLPTNLRRLKVIQTVIVGQHKEASIPMLWLEPRPAYLPQKPTGEEHETDNDGDGGREEEDDEENDEEDDDEEEDEEDGRR
jgi:hypothetical protein